MIKFFIKNTYRVFAIAATIGGAFGLIQSLTTQEEFSLTLTKQNEMNLISKSESTNEITILYNNQKVSSIYRSKFILENTGKKALTKEFIFTPISLTPKSGTTIIQISAQQPVISFASQNIKITWELLNPGEKISFEIISDKPFSPTVSGRIKEIPKIKYRDELTDPPSKNRIENLSILWLIIAIISILLMIDAIRLIKHDAKLQELLSLSKNTLANSIGRNEFAAKAIELYTEYFMVAPVLVTNPDEFARQINAVLEGKGKMTNDALRIARQTIANYALHSNLYTLRAYAIIYAPLILGFCVIRVALALT